jgi:hypothetical protein
MLQPRTLPWRRTADIRLFELCEPAKAAFYDHGSKHMVPFDMKNTEGMIRVPSANSGSALPTIFAVGMAIGYVSGCGDICSSPELYDHGSKHMVPFDMKNTEGMIRVIEETVAKAIRAQITLLPRRTADPPCQQYSPLGWQSGTCPAAVIYAFYDHGSKHMVPFDMKNTEGMIRVIEETVAKAISLGGLTKLK